MDIDQLRNWFPDETACRQFFENARRPEGRICSHCGHNGSYIINASHRPEPGYQCKRCKRQFRKINFNANLYETPATVKYSEIGSISHCMIFQVMRVDLAAC